MDKKLGFDQALQRAVKVLYPQNTGAAVPPVSTPGTPPSAPALNGSRISEEDWSEGSLSRPSQRDSTEPKGTDRATRAVARKQREMGIKADDLGPEEGTLPD